MLKNYLLILFTIGLSITGQTLLKVGMKNIGAVSELNMAMVIPLILKIATNINIIAGLSIFVIGTFFWLVILSRLDLSFVFPFGALQYLFIFLISYFLLGEPFKPARLLGIGIIMIGILVIGKWG